MPQCTEEMATLNRLQKTFTMKKVQYQGPRNEQRVSRRYLHTDTQKHTQSTNTHTHTHCLTYVYKQNACFIRFARKT